MASSFSEGSPPGHGTCESRPLCLQCCPLCTPPESQARAGEDGSTTRGPVLDGRTRASSLRHTPARTDRHVSAAVQGRSPAWSAHAPRRNNSFPTRGTEGTTLPPSSPTMTTEGGVSRTSFYPDHSGHRPTSGAPRMAAGRRDSDTFPIQGGKPPMPAAGGKVPTAPMAEGRRGL